MNKKNKELNIDTIVTRRQFIKGIAAAAGVSAIASSIGLSAVLAGKTKKNLEYSDITCSIVNKLRRLIVGGDVVAINDLIGKGSHCDPFVYSSESILENNAGISIEAVPADTRSAICWWVERTCINTTKAASSWEIEPHLLNSGINEIWLQVIAKNNFKRTYYRIDVKKQA